MKNSTQKMFILSTLLLAGVTTASTFAYQGQSAKLNLDEATRTAIESAISSDDYSAFQSSVIDLQRFKNITEDRFHDMVKNRSERDVHRLEMEKLREKIQEAITAKDFSAWRLIANESMTKIIDTESKFEKFVEMHNLMNQAQQIREELWLLDYKKSKIRNNHNNPNPNHKINPNHRRNR